MFRFVDSRTVLLLVATQCILLAVVRCQQEDDRKLDLFFLVLFSLKPSFSLVVNAFGVTVAIGGGKFVQVQRYLTRSFFSSHGLRICVLFYAI